MISHHLKNLDLSAPLLLMLAIGGCISRELTPHEKMFVQATHTNTVAQSKVRIARGVDGKEVRRTLRKDLQRSALTLKHNGKAVSVDDLQKALLTGPGAITIGSKIYYRKNYYQANFVPAWPRPLIVNWASLLAHEVTHVWQYQNRRVTGYSLSKIAMEHIRYRENVYHYNIVRGKKFLEYRFEQQGQIIQDWVTCRCMAPNSPKTSELEKLIEAVIPSGPYRRLICQQNFSSPLYETGSVPKLSGLARPLPPPCVRP